MDIRVMRFLCCVLLVHIAQGWEQKVCTGSSSGFSHSIGDRYERYRAMYENCTIVIGNLELVFLDEPKEIDLSFLSSIREVSGYVLISNVYDSVVPLDNLRVIHGLQRFVHLEMEYSLFVSLNYKPGVNVGVRELRMAKLREITQGDVYIYNNNLLCHMDSVKWAELLTSDNQSVIIHREIGRQAATPTCGVCDEACTDPSTGARHCWGEGAEYCNNVAVMECSGYCDNENNHGLCYGVSANECCHPECKYGCTGPTDKDCQVCRHYNNGGVCVPFCPRSTIYDVNEYTFVPNPDAKVIYDKICLDKCPNWLVLESDTCQRECNPGRRPEQGICEDLPPPDKRRHCNGTDSYPNSNFLNAKNAHDFMWCEVIDGDIRILQSTFDGDSFYNIAPMDPSWLEVLGQVEEITGYLMIQGSHENFKSLDFLPCLKRIQGNNLDHYGSSFSIIGTSLTALELGSAIEIVNGKVIIILNAHLCYLDTIDWMGMGISAVVHRNGEDCGGLVCSPECSESGCWGPSRYHCVACRNFIMEGQCIASCESANAYDAGNKKCLRCHVSCQSGCDGPERSHCRRQKRSALSQILQ